MSVISGKNGQVKIGATTLADVTQWTLQKLSNNPSYASSSTAGHKKRVAGVKDARGVVQMKFNDAAAAGLDEGDSVTLLLYVDATHFYSVPALVDSYRVDVDINTGEIVGATAEFSANGAWTEPTFP